MIRSFALAIALLATGCRNAPPAPVATVFQGPDGQPVYIDSLPVHRIVSTMQSATEWLVALGASDRLVARTRYDRQAELAHLPSIGGGLEASAEAVAALEPDVVLGWRIAASVNLARALEPFHIPVVAVEATDTAEAFRQLDVIASLVGLTPRADSLAAALRTELGALTQAHCPAGAAKASTLILVSIEPPMTAGGPTWMSELLGAACLVNLFGDMDAAWPTVSLEAIAARQPDWILTTRGDSTGVRLAELRGNPVWRNLNAVAAGRIIELDPDLFARLGPHMADWIRAVVAQMAAADAPAPPRPGG